MVNNTIDHKTMLNTLWTIICVTIGKEKMRRYKDQIFNPFFWLMILLLAALVFGS